MATQPAPQSKLLLGRWCVVTGASRGIGRAIAEAFAREGACLVLAARSEDDLRAVAESCSSMGAGAAVVVKCDLTRDEDVDALVRRAEEAAGGPVFGLVNNAGFANLTNGSVLEGDLGEYESTLRLNLLAPMRLTRLLAPGMASRGEGVIINVASKLALKAYPDSAVYCASKWGLRGYTKCCQEGLREKGIKVVGLNPALVDTAMSQAIGEGSRKIRVEDVAAAALLCLQLSPNAVPEEINIHTLRNPRTS